MDGYEASKKLREMGYTNPIIAVTANVVQGELEHCKESGMNDLLSKPFDKSQLATKLSQWV